MVSQKIDSKNIACSLSAVHVVACIAGKILWASAFIFKNKAVTEC